MRVCPIRVGPAKCIVMVVLLGAFIDGLKTFSEKNAFKDRIAILHPSGKIFSVDMERHDFGLGAANVLHTERFEIFLYEYGLQPASAADALIEKLKRSFSDVPGVSVVERRN
jgi:predicted ATPase